MYKALLTLYIYFAFTLQAFASHGGAHGDSETPFVPIVPLPSTQGGGIATSFGLNAYLNTLFEYAIVAGAGLAAIYIAIGGFEYIFSEAMESKKNGRLRIVNALFGLFILLLVTIVLFIINPDLVSLKFLE